MSIALADRRSQLSVFLPLANLHRKQGVGTFPILVSTEYCDSELGEECIPKGCVLKGCVQEGCVMLTFVAFFQSCGPVVLELGTLEGSGLQLGTVEGLGLGRLQACPSHEHTHTHTHTHTLVELSTDLPIVLEIFWSHQHHTKPLLLGSGCPATTVNIHLSQGDI